MTFAMVYRFLLIIAAMLLPAQALGNTLEGHWAFRIDEATIFVFRLDKLPGGEWTGAWKRPAVISSNGAVFRNMSGSEIAVADETTEYEGEVHLTFAGPAGSSRNDVLRFRLKSENQAELTYEGLQVPPYPLIRVAASTDLGPFEENRIYDRDQAVTEAPYDPPVILPGLESGRGDRAVPLEALSSPREVNIEAALDALAAQASAEASGSEEEEAAETDQRVDEEDANEPARIDEGFLDDI